MGRDVYEQQIITNEAEIRLVLNPFETRIITKRRSPSNPTR